MTVYYVALAVGILAGIAGQMLLKAGADAPDFVSQIPAVTIFDKSTATVAVANTTTETTLYSVSVPGGTLSTDNILHVRMNGTVFSNNGSGSTFRVKIKYGATTLYDSTSASVNDSSNTNPFEMNFILAANGATNAQKLAGRFETANVGAATAGYGYMGVTTGNGTGVNTPLYGTAAIDSTLAQTLAVTVTHSDNDPSISIVRQTVFAELLQ